MRALLVVAVLVGGCDLVYSLDRPTNGWRDVAVGFTHACGISPNGELYCWGSNTYGEVGVGDETSTIDVPTKVDGAWTAVTTTYQHTCALREDKSLWCWGLNASGQLGNGSTTLTRIPKQVDGTWTRVRASYLHTCAIDDDEHLSCWGVNTNGQLGDGTAMLRLDPTQIGDARWIDIVAGILHTCGIQKDGTLWCWGDDGSSTVPPAPILNPALATPSLVPVQVGTDTWRSLASVIDGTCGITSGGQLRCWGMNNLAQIGIGLVQRADEPTALLADGVDEDDWVQVDGGVYTACALRSSGDAWCWGDNQRGELTVEDLVVIEPQRVPPPKGRRWTRVAVGAGNACLIDDTAHMFCAGGDSFSQLGAGGTSPREPAPPAPDMAVDLIVAGDHATCALHQAQLACGGRGGYDQLGVGDMFSRRSLSPVAGGPWSSVSIGFEHACAIGDNGLVSCWGTDRTEAVGNGAGVQASLVPTPVATTRTFTALDAGANFSCGIDSTRAIACWGDNSTGQLGNGSRVTASIPASVVPTTKMWIAVSAGYVHACGIDSVGVVYCWGDNTNGQLGNNLLDANLLASTPIATGDGPLPAFAKLSAGADHTCAIGANDSLWCWGSNSRGQLGIDIGFFTESRAAKQVPGTWSTVSAGTYFTCAIRTDQTLWCWGANSRGQLGDGSLDDRRAPTQVDGVGWSAVSAGTDHVCARGGTSAACWGNNDDGATLTGDSWTTELHEILRPAP